MYAWHICVWNICGEEQALYPLQLNLRMYVSHHVSGWNWSRVIYKSNKCSWTVNHLFNSVHYLCKLIWLQSKCCLIGLRWIIETDAVEFKNTPQRLQQHILNPCRPTIAKISAWRMELAIQFLSYPRSHREKVTGARERKRNFSLKVNLGKRTTLSWKNTHVEYLGSTNKFKRLKIKQNQLNRRQWKSSGWGLLWSKQAQSFQISFKKFT